MDITDAARLVAWAHAEAERAEIGEERGKITRQEHRQRRIQLLAILVAAAYVLESARPTDSERRGHA